MIEAEIREIVEDPTDDGSGLNAIADEFRRGRDMSQVLLLLDSNSTELASIGAWILNELHFEFYASDSFVSRLHKLLEHHDSGVRFHALGALFPAFSPRDDATRKLLVKLRNDPNEGVRMRAAAAATRLTLAGD